MSWFKNILPSRIRTEILKKKKGVKEGIWEKCPSCSETLYIPELEKNLYVCTTCEYHFRISARDRISFFLDKDGQKEINKNNFPNIEDLDKLKFKDTILYKDRLLSAQKKTNEKDALIVIKGKINGLSIVMAVFEFEFLGGSMGTLVGKYFVQAIDIAIKKKIPLICFTASGGVRMQESVFALMQMVKVSAAIKILKQYSIPYIVVLTDPTTGGVSASLGMLGDIHIAEPQALIGFAGQRVIEQTVREKLPKDFQKSEFLQDKGMIDMIVPRYKLRDEITSLIRKLQKIPINYVS